MKLRLALAASPRSPPLAAVAGCGGGATRPPIWPTWRRPGRRSSSKAGAPERRTEGEHRRPRQEIAGIDDLGGSIVSELESSASDDGEKSISRRKSNPGWARRAASSSRDYDGGDFSGPGVISNRPTPPRRRNSSTRSQGERSAEGSAPTKGSTTGRRRRRQRDRRGRRLPRRSAKTNGSSRRWSTPRTANRWPTKTASPTRSSAASDGSLADVYVDVGGLIEQSGGEIDPRPARSSQSAGIDPSEATAVASLIPGSDQVEIDLSSDLGGEKPPTGDASELLGSLPPARSPRSPSPASANSCRKRSTDRREGHPRRRSRRTAEEGPEGSRHRPRRDRRLARRRRRLRRRQQRTQPRRRRWC